ncbi:MAG: phospholipase [Ectothiorhodospiraceae bacterium]|nr:phospholipase [Ectothiorhodospiraceae bacterium]
MIELYTRARPVASTVWLHGLGVNGGDMDAIVTNMRRSREIGLHHVAPNAPLRSITVNGGRRARAWFDVLGDPASVPEDRGGIEDSASRIRDILDAERAQGFASNRIILGGFSQGGSIALHAGLRYPHRLAGIVVLSGELVLPDLLAREQHGANLETPVLMIHGTDDEAIPVESARRGRDRLMDLGYPVHWHELPMGHEVTVDEIAIIDDWVHDRLKPALS